MTVKKRRRKQTWDIGDLFTISLADGTYCIGRVVGFEPEALNSAICAFYAHRVDSIPNMELNLSEDELISVLFVTRDLLDSGDWCSHIVLTNFSSINILIYILFEMKNLLALAL